MNKIRKTYNLPEDLNSMILKMKEEEGFESESAAVRTLIERGLRERGVFAVALRLVAGESPEEIIEKDPVAVELFRYAMLEHFEDMLVSFDEDLIEAAGGLDHLEKREIEAIHRLHEGELTFEKLVILLSAVMPKIAERDEGSAALREFSSGVASGFDPSQEERLKLVREAGNDHD